jgi:hypothetical protein
MTGDSAYLWSAHGVPNSVLLQKPFVDAQLITALANLLNNVAQQATARCRLGIVRWQTLSRLVGTTSGLRHFAHMPRYFFHTRHVEDLMQDFEGCRMLNDEEAIEFARAAAREVVAEGFMSREAMRHTCLEVVDEHEKHIATVPLRSVLH